MTLPIPKFARNERNLHCDVLHITTARVARLVLDDAIAAIQTSQGLYMSQIIGTCTLKAVSLADAADDQCIMSLSTSEDILLTKFL